MVALAEVVVVVHCDDRWSWWSVVVAVVGDGDVFCGCGCDRCDC